jgi:hypothetical protein
MVKGIDQFKAHFAGFADRYVLIGGAACYLAMDEAGLEFRVTKDLDIVLCIEALDAEFVGVFWEFVKKGGYKNRQKSTGKKLFYRFYEPEDETFPWMLELFSRIPDALTLKGKTHLTPIPVDVETSSLSAILLDEAYYGFIHDSKKESVGFTVVPPECLVPLKAKAWPDLTGRRDAGEEVNNKDIKKHKNDVFRLFQILEPDTRLALPGPIGEDLSRFLQEVEADPPLSLKPFGLKGTNIDQIIGTLREIYELNS